MEIMTSTALGGGHSMVAAYACEKLHEKTVPCQGSSFVAESQHPTSPLVETN